jgi:hypothetical protein
MQKKRSVDETRRTRTTRDPTDLVTKSGHEKKAEQNPFLLPTSDKTHTHTHTHFGQNTRTKHGSKLGTTIQPRIGDRLFIKDFRVFFL